MLNSAKSIWGFSPQSVAGLCLWLDAMDASSVTGNVTSVRDKSNNGNTATNATGKGVIYGSNVFMLSSTSYLTGTLTLPTTSFVCTTFVVAQTPSVFRSVAGVGFNNLLAMTSSAGSDLVSSTGQIVAGTSNATTGAGKLYGLRGTNVATISATTAVSTTILATSFVSSAGVLEVSLNGNYPNGSSTNYATSTDATGTATLVNYIIGSGSVAGTTSDGTYWGGGVNEVLIFNRVLTSYEIANIEGYLAWKWNLSSSLPAVHPYYGSTSYLTMPPFLKAIKPVDISSCVLWLDGADASTITIATGVSQWNDKSGNGSNAVQPSTSYQPTYTNNGLVFGGAQEMYTTTASASNTTQTGFVVASITSPSGSGNCLVGSQPSTTGFELRVDSSLMRFLNAGTTSYYTATLANPNAGTSAGLQQLLSYVLTAGVAQAYQNGVALSMTGSTMTLGTSKLLTIGGRAGNPGPPYADYLTGTIYEIIMFNVALTDPQRQYVEGYLMWKWGIQGNSYFPTSHPFYKFPSATYTTWSPKQIGGLAAWYDAFDPLTITQSSGTVSQVKDKSENGYDLTSGTGFTYPNNTFNGSYPSFYSSVSGSSVIGTNSSLSLPYPCTTFTVAVQTGATLGANIFIFDTVAPPPRLALYSYSVGTYTYAIADSTGQTWTYGNTTNIATILSATYTSSLNVWMNGTQVATNSTLRSGGFNGITLGSRYSLTFSWIGHICEVIIFSKILSINQIQQVEGYLAWKWGLMSSLANGHPFIGAPPSYCF